MNKWIGNSMFGEFPKRLIGIAFLLYIMIMCLLISYGVCMNSELSLQSIRTYVNNELPGRENYINLYGSVQLAFSKKSIDRLSVFKSSYGKLFEPRQKLENDLIDNWGENIGQVLDYLQAENIPCVYLSSVIPIQALEDMPYELDYYAYENSQKIQKGIEKAGVKVIDLMDSERVRCIPKEDVFYRTDHHWTMQTVFAAYQDVIDSARLQGLQLVPYKMDDFKIWTSERSFLGSYGIRIGSVYAGMDDFTIYIPDFETDFVFQSYDSEGKLILEKTGDFFACLHDQNILADDTYRNKYNAFSNGGYIENIIINTGIDNDYKLLYISHSYGRALAEYFALNFHEVRNLDPSPGRYDDNVLDYIENYDPDFVVIHMENEGFIVGELKIS